MITPKELAKKIQKQEAFASGGRWCAGCAFPMIVRTILAAAGENVVVSNATGCLEVTSTIYPYTSWGVPWIHNTFENAAATLSGVEAAYDFIQKQDEKNLPKFGKELKNKKVKFVAFGGDGGTYDIGLQSLSGALERGDDFVYVCYDNGAYMNTGNQRSSASPLGSSTTTAPAGKEHLGKEELRKDLLKIALAHNIPYVAQAAVHDLIDLYNKAEKAFSKKGPAVIDVLSPCVNWKITPGTTMEISRIAANTCFWPLYEVDEGKYKITYKPSKKLKIEEFLKPQGRFKHLFNNPKGKKIIEKAQEEVDRRWEELQELEIFTNRK